MRVPSNGEEAFTPIPLEAGRVYKIVFTGKYRFRCRWHDEWADAAYRTDEYKNFKLRYPGVEVAGVGAVPDGLDSWTEDRANHSYSCLTEGGGRQVPIRIAPPQGAFYTTDHLNVDIELMPRGTPSVLARQQARIQAKAAAELAAEQQRVLQEQQAEAVRRLAEQQVRDQEQKQLRQAALAKRRQHRLELRRRVQELVAHVQHEANLLDPQYCDRLVHSRRDEILRQKAAWTSEYQLLLGQVELVALIQQAAPEVLVWYERRAEMLLLAEQLECAALDEAHVSLRSLVPITYRTLGEVEGIVGELFAHRAEFDQLRRDELVAGSTAETAGRLEEIVRLTAHNHELLRRYGIQAQTPEDAEERFRMLCPCEPAKTVYEQVEERLEAGETICAEIITARVKDLFVEQCVLVWQRRRALRAKDWAEQGRLDQRIASCRAEFARWLALLKRHGFPVENARKDPLDRLSPLGEGIVRLCRDKLHVQKLLKELGDTEAVEQVEALYAERQVELFHPPEDRYT